MLEKGYIAEVTYLNMLDQYEQLIKSQELNREAETQDEKFRIRKFSQLAESEKRLHSHLEVIRENLEELVVKAPISGQITSLPVAVVFKFLCHFFRINQKEMIYDCTYI